MLPVPAWRAVAGTAGPLSVGRQPRSRFELGRTARSRAGKAASAHQPPAAHHSHPAAPAPQLKDFVGHGGLVVNWEVFGSGGLLVSCWEAPCCSRHGGAPVHTPCMHTRSVDAGVEAGPSVLAKPCGSAHSLSAVLCMSRPPGCCAFGMTVLAWLARPPFGPAAAAQGQLPNVLLALLAAQPPRPVVLLAGPFWQAGLPSLALLACQRSRPAMAACQSLLRCALAAPVPLRPRPHVQRTRTSRASCGAPAPSSPPLTRITFCTWTAPSARQVRQRLSPVVAQTHHRRRPAPHACCASMAACQGAVLGAAKPLVPACRDHTFLPCPTRGDSSLCSQFAA